MAFELSVEYDSLPENLGEKWVSAFLRLGFTVEICPGFDACDWNGGFLPFRVSSAPQELIGFQLPNDAASGFEVWFTERDAHFRSAMGRPTTEFAMQCMGAATLAELTGGAYVDPQSGIRALGQQAVEAAGNEIRNFLENAGPRERIHYEFPGWEELTG
jgi:hypothetical protein